MWHSVVKRQHDGVIEFNLTKGCQSIVDTSDADLTDLRWMAQHCSTRRSYAARRDMSTKKIVLLHRIIAERMIGRTLAKGEEVDHIDGNPFNNRRANLRVCTHGQNVMNARRRSDNTSGYKGVHYRKDTGRWQARLNANKKMYHLGCYDTAELAHAAYCEAAKKYAGEFARLE